MNSSYHLCVEYFSQLSFDSEVFTKSATAADFVYVMANVEARVESLYSSLKLGANVESSEKLIIRVDFLLVS